jgi:hypothetical protein
MKESSSKIPALSVVLGTDNMGRVTTVIDSLAAQTIAKSIELILVIVEPPDAPTREEIEHRFHSLKIVPVRSMISLSVARAKGVVAAEAPFVFIAETHAYPDPNLAEKIVAGLSNEWSVVVPGFRNANPGSAVSWAGFLSDYGAWSASLAPGEIQWGPSHDVAFRRSVLLEFGDRLENALTFGDEMNVTLKARGERTYFDPSAGIQHVNINGFGSFVRERFLTGQLIADYRRARWGMGRRLVYALASPLIPIVVLSRIQKGVREVARRESLPTGTIPTLVLGVMVKAAGEMRGYLFGAPASAEEKMTGFEVRKLAFNLGEES